MIDFKELARNGTALEQLVREILLYGGFEPHWTGVGPDQGRDLLFTERLTGPISEYRRKWLVQCKHTAHSGKSVGREDVGSFVDDCRQIQATGYLLVTTTQPSSSLQTKLNELTGQGNQIEKTVIWDAIELEKRLMEPRNFSLCHLFFPESFLATPWKVYNRGEPNKWAAHYKDYFIILQSRIAGNPPSLRECEMIFDRLKSIETTEKHEFIRPRAIFYDDKHDNYTAYIDFMHKRGSVASLKDHQILDILQDGRGLYQGEGWESKSVFFDLKFQEYYENSDHFDKDHYDYYCQHIASYESGMMRIPFWKRRQGRWQVMG